MSHTFIEDYPGGGKSEHLAIPPSECLLLGLKDCRCGNCRLKINETDVSFTRCPNESCQTVWQGVIIDQHRSHAIPENLHILPTYSEKVLIDTPYPSQRKTLGRRAVERRIELVDLDDDSGL